MKVLAFNFSFPNQVSFSLITLHKNVPSKLVSQRNSVAIIISMGIFCTKANASTIMQLNKNKTHCALPTKYITRGTTNPRLSRALRLPELKTVGGGGRGEEVCSSLPPITFDTVVTEMVKS